MNPQNLNRPQDNTAGNPPATNSSQPQSQPESQIPGTVPPQSAAGVSPQFSPAPQPLNDSGVSPDNTPQAVPAYSQPNPPPSQTTPSAEATMYAMSGSKPSNKLGIASLIFSVLAAPIGFVLGIIASVKGFSKHNRTLGFMGLSSVLLSIIVMLAFFAVYGWLLTRVDFSNLSAQNIDIGDGTSVSLQVPKDLDARDEAGALAFMKSFNHYESESNEEKNLPSISITVGADDLPDEFGQEVLNEVKNSLLNKSGPIYIGFNQSVKEGISRSAAEGGGSGAICKDDTTIGDAEEASIQGVDVALKFSIECTSPLDGRKLYGSAYTAFTEGKYIVIMATALDKWWIDNQEGWQKITDSIKVNE